ncbi:hypothetical protein [Pedobacter nyackensis]|uniref:hypothetical protein n=1 Tax=Pedobacter nyackensis TaxID=475255 RepID=UPI00292E24CA|nr:hypothetical protein [Pedobacter nyackensis]
MNKIPEDYQPDYKTLYEFAKQDLRNVKKQLEQWELKGILLRQLADELETFATEVEIRVGLLQPRQ